MLGESGESVKGSDKRNGPFGPSCRLEIKHVVTEANKAAHVSACFFIVNPNLTWIEEIPSCISHIRFADMFPHVLL